MLREVILRILREQLDQNTINVKNKYVGEGKPMTEEDFQKLMEVTGGKFYLLSWLAKKIGQNIIKTEDIYKYKEYFDIYEKNKNKGRFQHKDIHLYKTAEDVLNFIDEAIKVREGDIKFEETVGKDNYVSPNDIRKLEETNGIKYLGMFDGYQVFQIFHVSKDVWKTYRDILGKCKGREKGAKIEICTISSYSYFKGYLTDPKGSSYFLLYNLDDPKSPYQLHYESGQFMDKNDSSRINIDSLKFFEWIGKRVPKYNLDTEDFPGEFEIPLQNKGKRDEKGRKQGVWRQFWKGNVQKVTTYVNGLARGPFEEYDNGVIITKGFYGPNERLVGEFSNYYFDGSPESKGTFDSQNNRIGLWTDYRDDGRFFVTDYNETPISSSAFTKNGNLIYVSNLKGQNQTPMEPFGNIIFYHKNGNPKAIGRIGSTGAFLGPWEFYDVRGNIKSEGKYVRGKREGLWNDLIKTKDGEFLLTAIFSHGRPIDKVKIYNKAGEFLAKKKWEKIKPYYYWQEPAAVLRQSYQ